MWWIEKNDVEHMVCRLESYSLERGGACMVEAKVCFLNEDISGLGGFKRGVSLHSHTLYSKESLSSVHEHLLRVPLLSGWVTRQLDRQEARTGERLDLRRAYWTPPMSPLDAYSCEANQIEEKLGLEAWVSLTDHDDIQAPSLLQSLGNGDKVPISFEWTVPFGKTYFHIGIHNLPPDEAGDMKEQLCRYGADPESCSLTSLFDMLNEHPGILVVFNHPFWNQSLIDPQHHLVLLEAFLQQCRRWIHALEFNGINSWTKNKKVVGMAKELGLPVVAGSDRHGCQPAAVLNLTKAATFSEYVSEVRGDGMSQVVIMPHYLEPLKLRHVEAFWDIIRDHPERSDGRKYWNERVYYICDDGVHRPISSFPAFSNRDDQRSVRILLGVMRFIKSHPRLRPALRQALSVGESVP
jgi:hypothetical protein